MSHLHGTVRKASFGSTMCLPIGQTVRKMGRRVSLIYVSDHLHNSFRLQGWMVSPEPKFEVDCSGSAGLGADTNEPGRLLLTESFASVSTTFWKP
jgi:hypothetical protein